MRSALRPVYWLSFRGSLSSAKRFFPFGKFSLFPMEKEGDLDRAPFGTPVAEDTLCYEASHFGQVSISEF